MCRTGDSGEAGTGSRVGDRGWTSMAQEERARGASRTRTSWGTEGASSSGSMSMTRMPATMPCARTGLSQDLHGSRWDPAHPHVERPERGRSPQGPPSPWTLLPGTARPRRPLSGPRSFHLYGGDENHGLRGEGGKKGLALSGGRGAESPGRADLAVSPSAEGASQGQPLPVPRAA